VPLVFVVLVPTNVFFLSDFPELAIGAAGRPRKVAQSMGKKSYAVCTELPRRSVIST
jgi:hypothetical protein